MRKASIALLSLLISAQLYAATPKVNINTATCQQLAFLPSIGEKTCQNIIDARPYKAVAELTKAKGIKEKRLAKLTPYVVIDGATTATEKIKVPKIQ